jgi:hypothetical protein
MGVFGHIYGTIAKLWQTIKNLLYIPLNDSPEENMVKAIFLDSLIFLKDLIQQLIGSLTTSISSIKTGVAFLAHHYSGTKD